MVYGNRRWAAAHSVLIVCFHKLVSDGSLIVRVNATFNGVFPRETETEIVVKRKITFSNEHI